MAKSVRIKWPVEETKPLLDRARHCRMKRDGEPSVMDLNRFSGDTALRAETFVECCDCGLIHLHTYEVFRSDKRFYLSRRAYRLPREEEVEIRIKVRKEED